MTVAMPMLSSRGSNLLQIDMSQTIFNDIPDAINDVAFCKSIADMLLILMSYDSGFLNRINLSKTSFLQVIQTWKLHSRESIMVQLNIQTEIDSIAVQQYIEEKFEDDTPQTCINSIPYSLSDTTNFTNVDNFLTNIDLTGINDIAPSSYLNYLSPEERRSDVMEIKQSCDNR